MQNCGQIPQSLSSPQMLFHINELQEFDQTLAMAKTNDIAFHTAWRNFTVSEKKFQ